MPPTFLGDKSTYFVLSFSYYCLDSSLFFFRWCHRISQTKITLGQVMACCCQATSDYLNQCYRSMSPYGVTRAHCVNINVYCRYPDYYLAPIHPQTKRWLKLALCLVFRILLHVVLGYSTYWDFGKHKRNNSIILRSKRLSDVLITISWHHCSALQWRFKSPTALLFDQMLVSWTTKKTPKFRITGHLWGQSTGPVTGGLL